ncbi:hypothetical protein J2X31_000236 [Flavobacterium arsenatis]|uniref:Uncharacterized protein n=1 Tax=Flavobacterium arsenatis TaxID=1484332 RepID=A0ABU1TK54_9FLAO|nr:hypothetical protein [Flavobacterium arsenatis]MDR6966243.1 hypothetical protein [Flavobacterium arsenatis]
MFINYFLISGKVLPRPPRDENAPREERAPRPERRDDHRDDRR